VSFDEGTLNLLKDDSPSRV